MSAKADCEVLLNFLLPFAEQMLGEHGEFYPFGAMMEPDGELVSLSGDDGNEYPAPQDIADLIKGAFVEAAAAGTCKATALVRKASLVLPGDGVASDVVAVFLDHQDAYSVIVMVPYDIDGGHVTLGELMAQAGDGDIFPSA